VREGGRIEQLAVTGCDAAGGTVRRLDTVRGSIAVDTVVLAAGGASGGLGRAFGLSLPFVAERGYHVMLEAPAARFEVPVTWSEYGFVLTPMEGAGIRLAGTVELGAPTAPPSWARAELLVKHAARLFPELGGRETSRWMGIRPTLPDYLPAIGNAPRHDNVFVACGHQHIGLTTATATAQLIRDLVAGKPPAIDLAPFAAGRFA
jgi:glycine/D-amino acid oxidase-like deaminating enzyme